MAQRVIRREQKLSPSASACTICVSAQTVKTVNCTGACLAHLRVWFRSGSDSSIGGSGRLEAETPLSSIQTYKPDLVWHSHLLSQEDSNQ
jgi:hypothetical protein